MSISEILALVSCGETLGRTWSMMSLSTWHGSLEVAWHPEATLVAVYPPLPNSAARRAPARVACAAALLSSMRFAAVHAEKQQQEHGEQHRHLDHRLAAPGVTQAHHCCGS